MVGPGGTAPPGTGGLQTIPQDVRDVGPVVSESEEISVAAEPRPQNRRHGESVHFRPQKDLRRIDGPGGEHYVSGVQCKRFARFVVGNMRPVNPPASGRKLFHPFDLRLGVDLRPGAARHGQEIHVKSILRTHVAARNAVAAVCARFLLDAVRVLSINGEVHVDVESISVQPDFRGAALHGLHFRQSPSPSDVGLKPAPGGPAGNRASGHRA